MFGPGAVGIGWDLGFLGLARHLAAEPPMDAEAAMAWQLSDGGREFVRQSSERWYEASVAAGEDEQSARAAADRTTEAYTTPPEPHAGS
jgi:hypothetical protein